MSTLWRVAEVVSGVPETASSRTIGLRVDGLNGNLAGQHIDIRLTADDGYTAVRSYSVATAGMDEILEITVDELANGEVSPYLVRDLVAETSWRSGAPSAAGSSGGLRTRTPSS